MSNALLGRPMEILLVEDNRLDARIAIEALKDGQIKHRLTLIPDGKEAMLFLHRAERFARAPRPDLILLDLNLPGKDGREILTAVRDDYELREIPVIVLTASADEYDRQRSELLLVDGYMVKPFDTRKFVALVRDLINRWDDEVILPAAVQV